MSEPYIDLHLTPKHLQAIGMFSARWSFFETEIDFTVSALGSLVEDDQRLPGPFNQRLRRWRKLAAKLYKTNERAAHDATCIIDAAKSLHDDRCYILHGRVYGDPSGESDELRVEYHRHLAEWKYTRSTTTVEDIHRAVRETERATRELMLFNREFLSVHPDSLPYRWL